jgi:hypothetical protein
MVTEIRDNRVEGLIKTISETIGDRQDLQIKKRTTP